MDTDSVKQLETSLKGKEIGHKIHFLNKINSTQNYSRYLLKNCGLPLHGVVVIAKEQSAGRGRMGRKWISPPGGLWMSIILQSWLTPRRIPIIQFISALAVADSISTLTSLECTNKWPNDLLVRGKKICGVIVDVDFEGNNANQAIIGIGLNANFSANNMNDLENQIKVSRLTTLRDELGYDIHLLNLTKLILERLEYYYSLLKEDKIKVIIEIWKKRSDLFGRVVTVEDGKDIFHGLAMGVDDNGVLEIKLSDGSVREVLFGDVNLSIKPHRLNDQPDLASN
jgi:BirA family biotin operon repressor/biotin-[acetyl-CoA-carboxylase] ligase